MIKSKFKTGEEVYIKGKEDVYVFQGYLSEDLVVVKEKGSRWNILVDVSEIYQHYDVQVLKLENMHLKEEIEEIIDELKELIE